MIRRIFASPLRKPETVEQQLPPTLAQCREWTGGGFEIVRLNVPLLPPGSQMIVHDDGHPLGLPIRRGELDAAEEFPPLLPPGADAFQQAGAGVKAEPKRRGRPPLPPNILEQAGFEIRRKG